MRVKATMVSPIVRSKRVCESRRVDGLHGLAIQWGLIGDVGYVSDVTNDKQLDFDGLKAQRIRSCLQTLDRMLHSSHSVLASYVKTVRQIETNGGKSIGFVAKLCQILGIGDQLSLNKDLTLAQLGIDSIASAEISCLLEEEGLNVSLKTNRDITVNDIINMKKH